MKASESFVALATNGGRFVLVKTVEGGWSDQVIMFN